MLQKIFCIRAELMISLFNFLYYFQAIFFATQREHSLVLNQPTTFWASTMCYIVLSEVDNIKVKEDLVLVHECNSPGSERRHMQSAYGFRAVTCSGRRPGVASNSHSCSDPSQTIYPLWASVSLFCKMSSLTCFNSPDLLLIFYQCRIRYHSHFYI